MLKVMCPECHHRFPVLGCCLKWNDELNQKKMKEDEKEKKHKEEEKEKEEEEEYEDNEEEEEEAEEEEEDKKEKEKKQQVKMVPNIIGSTATYYVNSIPMSCGYTSGSSCFIKPSTNIRESTIFQRLNDQDSFIMVTDNFNYDVTPSEQYIATTCDLTGGNVTIATPDIQSSDYCVQNTESDIQVQASQIKIQPKLTGGGCLVQKKLSTENERLMMSKHSKNFTFFNNNACQTFVTPFNKCTKLPEDIKISGTIKDDQNNEISVESRQQKIKTSTCCNCKSTFQQNHCQNHRRLFDTSLTDNRDSLLLEPISNSVQVRVNATVQLPANLGHCTVNITATTTTPPKQVMAMKLPDHGRNNFHGGGIVQPNELDCTTVNQIVAVGNSKDCNNVEQRSEAPTIPTSWLMPTSWGLDSDVNRLRDIKRLLQICGWYHEGISWQQSENLLKDASIGRWLMRDSSDSRYTFAISVKTSRGPASIRVHYFLEQFRLDAAPKLALAMPFFDCPIKMLEYYIEYSKRMDEHRREVWVDFSGQLYSQIYLTKPLVKEVRSLSHLARLAVNRSKLPIEHLPLLIKNYIKEYPYTL
ncbi:hypothetical protein PUN28_016271 [Cardiocondyla obscurior]|uniref:SH2 domain-containing protein n=2 Tax=Cardiocondyla obscurior TaxID=286306 RepID=A0AAW2ERQ1_9HYME